MKQTAKRPNIAIIGAGVAGLTCGVAFAEEGHRVSVFAEEFGPWTTSGAAGAIWFPYDVEPVDKVIAWSIATYHRLHKLATDPTSGVSMIELRYFARAGEITIPYWAPALGACRLTKPQNPGNTGGIFPPAFTSGFSIRVPLTDTTRYLDYLRERFEAAAGIIKDGVRFQKLEDVSTVFEIIVNCTGIGARELVKDPELEPHRGQTAIVPKLDLPCAIVADDPPLMYAIPRRSDCVFGGTNEVNASCEAAAEQTRAIVRECCRVLNVDVPPVIATRVGLRPYRKTGVRLESEQTTDGRRVIHNYGHGGSGFTLSWGCAEDALKLCRQLTES